MEYAVTHSIVVGIEYQHMAFDDKIHFSSIAAEHRLIDMDADIVKARLSFKLGRRKEDHELMK